MESSYELASVNFSLIIIYPQTDNNTLYGHILKIKINYTQTE